MFPPSNSSIGKLKIRTNLELSPRRGTSVSETEGASSSFSDSFSSDTNSIKSKKTGNNLICWLKSYIVISMSN